MCLQLWLHTLPLGPGVGFPSVIFQNSSGRHMFVFVCVCVCLLLPATGINTPVNQHWCSLWRVWYPQWKKWTKGKFEYSHQWGVKILCLKKACVLACFWAFMKIFVLHFSPSDAYIHIPQNRCKKDWLEVQIYSALNQIYVGNHLPLFTFYMRSSTRNIWRSKGSPCLLVQTFHWQINSRWTVTLTLSVLEWRKEWRKKSVELWSRWWEEDTAEASTVCKKKKTNKPWALIQT